MALSSPMAYMCERSSIIVDHVIIFIGINSVANMIPDAITVLPSAPQPLQSWSLGLHPCRIPNRLTSR